MQDHMHMHKRAVIFVERTEIGEIVTILRFGGDHKNAGLDGRQFVHLAIQFFFDISVNSVWVL